MNAAAEASNAMALEAARSAESASEAAQAAVHMAREATRARISTPSVSVFVMSEVGDPFVLAHLQSKPQMPDPRLWESPNVHSRQPVSSLGDFVVDESVGVLIWFRVRLQVENVGAVPALIELSGEMRFIDASMDDTLDSSVQLPSPVLASTQRRALLKPGRCAVAEWFDCVEAKACMVSASMYTTITILDHAGAVVQWIPIAAGRQPLEYVHGRSVTVRAASFPQFGATVHPHLTWYRHQGAPRPELPWNI